MPGVPPDAVNQLKRAFKGLFRKKPKDKSTQQQNQQPSAQQAAATPAQLDQQQQAPEVVPQQQQSPPTSALGSKHLPPTHPLVTSQHTRTQEAIPTDAAAPDPNVAGGPEGQKEVKEMEGVQQSQSQSQQVSPVEAGPAPAVEKEAMPATTAESGREVVVEGLIEGKGDATTPQQSLDPSTVAASANAAAPAPTPAKENVPPPTTSTNHNTTLPPAPATNDPSNSLAPAPNQSTAAPNTSPTDTGKILTTEAAAPVPVNNTSPAAVPDAKPTPAMTATSGPLEEFFEGGDPPPPSNSQNEPKSLGTA